jgi:hypothetical protein
MPNVKLIILYYFFVINNYDVTMQKQTFLEYPTVFTETQISLSLMPEKWGCFIIMH